MRNRLPDNVTPIRPRLRVRPDKGEQASVSLNRRLYDNVQPKLVEAAIVGDDELTRVHTALHIVARKNLPAFNLRLIVRDDLPAALRLEDAARRVDLAEAEWKLAEARARIVWMEGGSNADREAHRDACDAARDAYKEAVSAYLAIPSGKRFHIDRKRSRVGSVMLKAHPEWQALIAEDEARLPRKVKEAAHG